MHFDDRNCKAALLTEHFQFEGFRGLWGDWGYDRETEGLGGTSHFKLMESLVAGTDKVSLSLLKTVKCLQK